MDNARAHHQRLQKHTPNNYYNHPKMLLHLRSRTNPLSIISLSRSYTTHHHRPRPAFAFDIDGVLIRGGIVLDQGKRALKLLKERNIPHVFLTNGGGVTEAKKALELSKKFDHPVCVYSF